MSYTLYPRAMRNTHTYHDAEQGSSKPQTDKDLALRAVPELKSLKIPEEQLYARARAIAKIDATVKDPAKAFGKTEAIRGGDDIVNNLQIVRQALLTDTSPNASSLASQTIATKFEKWDAPGNASLYMGYSINKTMRVFLQQFINDADIVASIFHVREEVKAPPNPETVAQISRCSRFLVALEGAHPDAEYKPMFRRATAALKNNDLRIARKELEEPLKNEWKIDFDKIIASSEGLSASLRIIGNTAEAAKIMVKDGADQLNEGKDLSGKEIALRDTIKAKLGAEKGAKMQSAQKVYGEMLKNLPENDPMRLRLQSQQAQMIDEIASEQAFIAITDTFIKNTPGGSAGLGKVYKDFDDMRGLYGNLNFSDENKKIATESAIMLGSFILTAGIGPALAMLAVGARTIATSGLLAATQISEKANRARKLANTASNAGKAVTRGVLNGTATVAAVGAVGDEALQANKIARTAGEALKFTAADTIIRTASRSEGEKSTLEFEQFFTSLAKNTAMFTAFGGVEKLINVQVLNRLKTKFPALKDSKGSYLIADLPALTAGDITVMMTLHAIETGKMPYDADTGFDWIGVYQGLALRAGMRGYPIVQKLFPNIAQKIDTKFKNWNELTRGIAQDARDTLSRRGKTNPNQSQQGIVPEGSFHAGGREKDIEDAKYVDKARKPIEGSVAKEKSEAPLDGTRINTQIKDMKVGETVTVTTQNNTYRFAKIEGERFMLVETTNPEYKSLIGKPGSVSTSISYSADTGFVADKIFANTSTVKSISFEKPNYFREQAANQLIRLEGNGKIESSSQNIVGPNDPTPVRREALQKRIAELEKFKQENPGNITRDADLLRAERELNQIDSILTPEFFSNISGLLGKPHGDFISSIKESLSKGEFPQFPGKDGYVWTIRKIEPGKGVGKEQVTIGELGSSQEMTISMKELKDTINTNIKKYLDWQKQYGDQVGISLPGTKPKKNEVTEAFFEKLGGYEVPKDLTTFVSSIRDVLRAGKFPQYPGGDGYIWSIRSVGRGSDPYVTVGITGRKKTEQIRSSELQTHLMQEIVNYREGMRSTSPSRDLVPVATLPADVAPSGRRSGFTEAFDANGRPIDRNAQARIEKEHGIGREPRSAVDAAQVFEAATMGPPTRETVMKNNLERTLTKTRSDIENMKGTLRDMENSTGQYDSVTPNPEALAGQRADIARAEKHLASLEQSARELTPLRQSRREVQEQLRAERQKLIDMSPEARAAELARVQAEGKELIGRKGDLEKKLETEKDKITWDERRALEKDIEEISKKIDANKRQENMVKRADTIAMKLTENGIDPKAAAEALANPTKRKELGEWLDKQRENNKLKGLALLLLLLLLGAWLWNKGDNNTNEPEPRVDPSTPSGPQLDAVCGEQSKKPVSEIKTDRKNEDGIVLTEKRRESISKRFMETPEWKALEKLFRENRTLFESSRFTNAFEAMLKNPTPYSVRHIQQWIGMEGTDDKKAQDGILGPITTAALRDFLNKCRTNKNVPEEPPASNSGE